MPSLVEEHDELIKNMPEGATHLTEDCFVCTDKLAHTDSLEGVFMTTAQIDQTAIDTAIQAAVAPLQAKLDEYESAQAQEAAQARIDEAVAAKQVEVDDLQSKLDAAEAKANLAEKSFTDLETLLTEAKAEADAAAEIDARKDDRRAAIAALEIYTDEQLDAKIDRWAAQPDEVFTATLEDLTELATASKDKVPSVKTEKVDTAMSHVRSSDSAEVNPMQALFAAKRSSNVDLRKLS